MTQTSAATSKIIIVLNSSSGSERNASLRETIVQGLASSAGEVHLVEVETPSDLPTACERAVQKARASGALVVAAGGDGTVNLVAAHCHRHKVAMGVLPLGTFNYFARELGIPTDLSAALDVLTSGRLRRVAAGFVQEHLFINNASFGLYTTIIRNRERSSSRFGRLRGVAALSAAASLLQEQTRFAMKLIIGGQEELRRTSMVFVGNSTFQLENLGLDAAACTKRDKLAVVIMRPMTRAQTARLLLRGAIGQLKYEEKLEEFCADSFEVETTRRHIHLVIDGEIIQCQTPLAFRVEPDALQVMVPREGAAQS